MRTRYRKILVAAALTALALTAIFATAANAATPPAPYQDFAGCTSQKEDETVAQCIKYVFESGHLKLGSKSIQVTNPIVLRGAYQQSTGNFLFNSEGGIVPVRQAVTGGLIGVTGLSWLDEAVENSSALKLYASVELAGNPGSVFEPNLALPIKVHLENPLLGSSCYIGSNSDPISLDLTTGATAPPAPNSPITGKSTGELEAESGREVLTAKGGTHVDNAFAVPGANGCQLTVGGFHISLDNLVDASMGLPSAAGHSEAVLNYSFSVASPEVVYP